MTPMQGDILFYKRDNSLISLLIAWWTHSQFVHCGVDMGDGTTIEAVMNGVWRRPIGTREPGARWSYWDHTQDRDLVDLNNALGWLKSMVGAAYGVDDVIGAVYERFFTSFYLVMPRHYDCSALCTEFLIEAGGIELGPLTLNPHKVTPAVLARRLGVST